VNGATDFLADVAVHLREFAAAHGVPENRVIVEVTLADGALWNISDFRTTAARGPGRWGLLPHEKGAVVVRESHVLKVKLRLSPDSRTPIGFHAETNE
jgi:hypothetical protein